MQKIEELANYYVAFLRAIYLTHQNSHWLTKGASFYGEHLMLERIYKSASEDADAGAEKMIGVFGEEALDPRLQFQLIHKILDKLDGDDPLPTSLSIEKRFIQMSKKISTEIQNAGKMTQGLNNLLEEIASNRETAIYLLQQSLKNPSDSTSKFAARRTLLNRLAQQVFNPNELQQKLTTRLLAVVPSYTQSSVDVSVMVDMANKKIWGTVKLPKTTTPEIQGKIQTNFRQYAYSLLPKNMQDFVVGIGFVIQTPTAK